MVIKFTDYIHFKKTKRNHDILESRSISTNIVKMHRQECHRIVGRRSVEFAKEFFFKIFTASTKSQKIKLT